MGSETQQWRHADRQWRGRIDQTVDETNRNENQDQDPERPVDREQPMIIGQGGRHPDPDEQHRQDHRSHQPMQNARENWKQLLAHGETLSPVLETCTSLGVFSSPARRVKEVE